MRRGFAPSVLPTCTLTVCLLMTLTSCELGNDLQVAAKQLSNPDAETIESGGNLIAEGQFRRLRFDGTTADGAYVVAIKEGTELVIIPFSGATEGCSAGPARASTESMSTNEEELNARIPFVTLGDANTPDTLRFTNFECEFDSVAIPNAGLPLRRDFGPKPGFIVQTNVGELYFVSPWKEEATLIADNLSGINRGDLAMFAQGTSNATWLWTLERGEIVARDREFEEVFRAGEDIATVAHSSSGMGGPMLAIRDSERTLYTVLASAPDDVKLIAEDTCGATFNYGDHGRELLFYSPCDDRNLRVYELETDTLRTIRDGIDDYKVSGSTDTGPLLLYMTGVHEDDEDLGTLWARWGQNDPIKISDEGNFHHSRISGGGWVRLIDNWDGTSGDLHIGQLGEELHKVAEKVAYHTVAGIVSDFDGENGLLQRLTQSDGLEPVMSNVSIQGIRHDGQTNRTLLLHRFDGTSGQLALVEGKEVRKMSMNVRPGSYQFTALLPMVTLLADLDEETNTATLKLHRTDRDEEIEVAKGVAETIEVAWPEEGLLYSAPAGDPPGIYFARTL